MTEKKPIVSALFEFCYLPTVENPVQCQKVIDEFYYHLAIGIFNIQHIYDPELILLGGAISCRETFVEEVYQGYEKIKEVCDLAYITPKIKCCTFQQDANLLGALANFLQQENGK